jgi:two-component system phosphate regulon sensor histidine kinase PhoR
MRSSRLYWKLFSVSAGAAVALAALFAGVLFWGVRPLVIAEAQQRLHDVAGALRTLSEGALRTGDRDALQRAVSDLYSHAGVRCTVLDASGNVLADSSSDPREMSNHGARPEIIAATSEAGIGISWRESETLGLEFLYVALPVERDRRRVGFVRVAEEAGPLRAAWRAPFTWGLAAGTAVLAVAAALGHFVVLRVVAPLEWLGQRAERFAANGMARDLEESSRGSREVGPSPTTADDDEIARLRTAFDRIQGAVDAQGSGLRSSNERLLGMMRSMEEGVLALDADERIALINEAGRRLLEMGDAEVVGRHLWELTRLRALRDAFSEAMSTGRASAKEFETTGAERHVLTLRAARLPGDPTLGVMIVLHDVTELRRLENLRRDFVANVSHELKTPLASIKAYAETLRLGALHDAEHNQQFVARIEEQADRLHQLIIDLLHLARVESGQQAFDIAEVCLRSIVDASVAAHAASAASRQITIASEPPAIPIEVLADEEGVRTIVNNLVDNAIKYTPGGGKVTVRWRQEGGHAILEVQDTGIGIARQHQARVFERFYRVDKARSREMGGTGLGLAIVKHLVQAFGGSVGIESQPRVGSTFRVTLPLASPLAATGDNFTDP